MSDQNYRPEVGETVFYSLMSQKPRLITVNGYLEDERCSSEQFTFTYSENGKTSRLGLNSVEFFPGVSVDAQYVYCLVLEIDTGYDSVDTFEERYFFDPEAAFAYQQAFESGEVRSRCRDIQGAFSSHIEIERV